MKKKKKREKNEEEEGKEEEKGGEKGEGRGEESRHVINACKWYLQSIYFNAPMWKLSPNYMRGEP